MLTNWFTLRGLVQEWQDVLVGAEVADAYSQNRGSLILVFRREDAVHSLNVSVQAPHRHVFRYDGGNRARRNVADLFPDALGATVTSLGIADRDRIVSVELSGGMALRIIPFGPAANVFLLRDGIRVDAFRGEASDTVPLEPRPAPVVADGLAELTPEEAKAPSMRMVGPLLPLFPKPLVREVLARTVSVHEAGDQNGAQRLVAAAEELEEDLCAPKPVVYWKGSWPELLSPVPLTHLASDPSLRAEPFDSLDLAVRIVARGRLARSRFEQRYRPLVTAVERTRDHLERSLGRMTEELDQPSRADTYETFGHLLMATPGKVPAGAEEATLDDIIGGEGTVTITLDPALTAIQNAERYYDRARRTRASRANATDRLEDVETRYLHLSEMADALAGIDSLDELDAFAAKHETTLKMMARDGSSDDGIPYRRYILDDGYEVWVGRNAKQNDQLTLRDSQKYDLWMHARGVAGSHTILRLKGRTDTPPKHIVAQAAAIAAYHSKARTSSLAPVIITERKYVRKPRKALPGAVLVERERVLMVEPALP